MPYPFALPTTSFLSFPDHLHCASHPSLPYQATSNRSLVRSALKAYKRLPSAQKPAQLSTVLAALQDYLPHLHALAAALSGQPVAGDRIDLALTTEIEVQWRSTLAAGIIPGREGARAKVRGLDAELAYTYYTLATTYCLLARVALRDLYDRQAAGGALQAESRTSAIATAMKHLLDAHAAYAYIAGRPAAIAAPIPADIATPTLTALAAAALAEATVLAVLKDDPFPAAVAAARAAHDTTWLVGAPRIPHVRAHLFARLCLAAADHAGRAAGILTVGAASTGGAPRPTPELARYAADLRRAARAKACRFLGVDADAAGETGAATAWLRAAAQELGEEADAGEEGRARGGLARLRREWAERREDRRVERSGEWGADGGRADEARVLAMLGAKWERESGTVNAQVVPPVGPLLAALPSGREYHAPRPWVPPALDAGALAQMRAPVDEREARAARDEGDDDSDADAVVEGAPGAFPSSQYY